MHVPIDRGELDNLPLFMTATKVESATMCHMRNTLRLFTSLGAFVLFSASLAPAQGTNGALDLTAHITPTGARPEPVRQFVFYVLTRSYADIIKEVEGQDVLPTLEQFIDRLTCSPELKTWLKAHAVIDLTSPDLDQVLTPDDIMKIPEFFAAYQRANSGGVTVGLPKPKYRELDKESNPDKYKKQKEEFLAATKKFIETHRSTVQGMELELSGVNPKLDWDRLQLDHKRRVTQLAPDTAQIKYLAGKMETDLDGHALIAGLPPGNYWVSTLGMDASSGDRHLQWDVPVTVQAGQATHVDLTNLNAWDSRRSTAP